MTLGGRQVGGLKDTTIEKITSYYRKAISDHTPNVEEMKMAIYATLRHYSSTDQKPQHTMHPEGPTSWCFYNRQKAQRKLLASHDSMKVRLSDTVLAKILPCYQRLAAETLLECYTKKMQNSNESIHSVIWNKCPKETFVSKNKLELAVIKAIAEFNTGMELC